jgi:hypothetical protein
MADVFASTQGVSMTQRMVHAAQILWPAFLVAAVLEMVVFAWVDPGTLRFGRWEPEAMTAYSLAFMTFWMLISTASGMSQWLAGQQRQLARVPVHHRSRHRGR